MGGQNPAWLGFQAGAKDVKARFWRCEGRMTNVRQIEDKRDGTVSVDVAKSYVFTTLSTPPEKHRFWSTPQQQSSTAACPHRPASF